MSNPVFVDPSGRRRWVLRAVIGAASACVLGFLALLVVALANGPVNPSSLLPLVDEETPVVAPTAVVTAVPADLTTTLRATTTTSSTTADDVESTTAAEPTTTTATTTTTKAPQGRRTEPPPGASNRPSSANRG